MTGPPPGTIPEPRGIFKKISPTQFRAVALKAQGFTEAQVAQHMAIKPKTVSSYIESCRYRLDIHTTQEVMWAYFEEYVPALLHPEVDEDRETVS